MHPIVTKEGDILQVNSMHHQAIYPFDLPKEDYQLIAWAENLSEHHEDGDMQEMNPPVEPELCYFPKIKFLGSQYHMEAMSNTSDVVKYGRNLLDRFMAGELDTEEVRTISAEENSKL